MKKGYVFYIFVLLFAGGVYYFDYYKGEETKKNKEETSLLVSLAKDKINKIELKTETTKLELNKVEGTWKVTAPIQDLADSNQIDEWLSSLISEKSTATLGEGEKFEWFTYGLDKPKASIVFSGEANDRVELELATRKNFEGNSFLRKNQGPVVLLGSGAWDSLLNKNLFDVRDKRLLRQSLADIEEVSIQLKTHLVLQSKEGVWLIKDKPALKLSQNLARDLVNTLNELRATEFKTEGQPNAKEKSEWSLDKPNFSVKLKFKGDKIWSIDFAEAKDKFWYVLSSDMNKIVKVDSAQVEKLNKATEDGLRDRETPFAIKKDEVRKISYQVTEDPNKSMEFSKEGDKWKSTLPGEVDEIEVTGLLSRLNELRVADFTDGKVKDTGVDKPSQKIILADQEGKSLWSMVIGKAFAPQADKSKARFFYVKTSAFDEVFTLAESNINNLGFDKLIKKKSEEKPK